MHPREGAELGVEWPRRVLESVIENSCVQRLREHRINALETIVS